MHARTPIVALVLTIATPAAAQHDHHHGPTDAAVAGPALAASVALVAAAYDTRLYEGAYQGVTPALRYADARFVIAAALPYYRLTKNGLTQYGPGDAMVHGTAALVRRGGIEAGVALAVMLPIGDAERGFGMGHVMLMPGVWGSYARDRLALAASVSYGRGIGDSAEHEHGLWPLVDPMNLAELTAALSADLAVAPGWRAGVRASGAVPVGEPGDERVIGGARVAWTRGRVATAASLQAGIVGGPFDVRGVVETAVSF